MYLNKVVQFLIIIVLTMPTAAFAQKKEVMQYFRKGPYLGLENPGSLPVLFSPVKSNDIEIHSIPLFYRKGNLLVFKGSYSGVDGLFITENSNRGWTKPELIIKLSKYNDRHFFMTLDEKKICFTSMRPIDDKDILANNPNIWVINRNGEGWSDPQRMDKPINSDDAQFYATVSGKNTFYYTISKTETTADILYSEYDDGKYLEISDPGSSINTPYAEVDPYISPDEKFLIFLSNRPGTYGFHDLYISFRNVNGLFSQPWHLDNTINSEGNDVCPLITPDGRYFFFMSNRSGSYRTYWMNTGFIEKLKRFARK